MLRPDLNGREGFAEAFNGTINRYTVRFNQGESLQLLASQLIHVNDSTPDTDTHEKSQLVKDDQPFINQQHYQGVSSAPGPSIQSLINSTSLGVFASYAMPATTGAPLPTPIPKHSPPQPIIGHVGNDLLLPVESPEDVIKAYLAKREEIVNAPEMCGDYTLEEYMGDEGNGERLTGILLWFDQTKQYGFIAPENGKDNYFTHGIDIYDQVYKGQKVHFEHGTDISGRKKACMVTPGVGIRDLAHVTPYIASPLSPSHPRTEIFYRK
jgi:cold shock CspA family protein